MPYIEIDPDAAAAAPATTLGDPLTSTGMTLGEMRQELDLMLSSRPDVGITRLERWINWGYVNLAASIKFGFLKGSITLSLVADQPLYNLPTITHATIGAALSDTDLPTDGRPLSKSSLVKYRTRPVRKRAPEEYFRGAGQVLIVWPTPKEVHSCIVDIRFLPKNLEASTDSSILGTQWDEIILLNARRKALAALMEWEAAALAKNDFVSEVRQLADPEHLEEEGQIVRSSVPRTRSQLLRRNTYIMKEID